jgi:hypothetical protein
VSESLSVPAMARSRAISDEPLVRAVLDRLLADEGPHARLGFWFLDWAAPRLTDAERAHLARVAEDAIEVYAPLWQDAPCAACPLPRGLGGHAAIGKRALRAAVELRIAKPLRRHGIELDRARLQHLAA